MCTYAYCIVEKKRNSIGRDHLYLWGHFTVLDLRYLLSVICTVVSDGSTIIWLGEIVVTELSMSLNLAVKFSVCSTSPSFMIDILKHCLGRWLVKVSRVIETLV